MTDYTVKRLALVLAIQAEIEGMKSENALRRQNNESPTYGHEQFNQCKSQLEELAYKHDEQL